MPPTNQRQDKKNHSIHAPGVLLSLLSAPEWKEAIRALQIGDEVVVGVDSARRKHDAASRIIRRYRLAYVLTRVASACDTEPRASLFRLQATDYPSIEVFAEEYPEAIGVEAYWDPVTQLLVDPMERGSRWRRR